MATLRTIRLRIKGTKNIKQITRAMEAVSAVKMRKSQQVALAARPYATAALRLLKNLESSIRGANTSTHPFLQKREVKTILLLVVTSDKGLAGSFNANVLKKAMEFVRANEKRNVKVKIASVGKKANEFFRKRGYSPIPFKGLSDTVTLADIIPIYSFISIWFGIVHEIHQGDEIYIIYTNFLSAMKQEVVVRKLLPFSEEGLEEMVEGIVPERGRFAAHDTNSRIRANDANKSREYLFEPSPQEIFDELLPSLLKIQMYHAILEANASEHSSRMIAMKNATDNAGELIKSYTVSLNKARQAAINKELAEITGGSEALAA